MRRVGIMCAVVAVLLVTGCGSPPPSAPTQTPGKPGTELGESILVHMEGSLSYKRPGWDDYLPLSFGVALKRGDLLQAAPDASGLVVCPDLSLALLPAGYGGGLPCAEAVAVLERGESLVLAPQRGTAFTGSIPYVLSPRHTFILTQFPTLRWKATDGGTAGYSVRVWGADVDWTTTNPEAELTYPQDAPPLHPGVTYRLTVKDAAGHSSDEEGTALDLGFVLMSPDQVSAVQALAARAQGLGLDEAATRLVEAEILASSELRADAMAVLEALPAGDRAPSVWQRLGDLYREVGLYAEADSAYESSRAGFHSLGDTAGEASASAGRALAQWGNDDQEPAQITMKQAIYLFQAIGDADGARRAEQMLAELGGQP